jgi:tetratricopeptide (TPR) repeat protein
LGRAQAATLERYQIQEAVASLERAFDYYAEAGDVARGVAVAEYPVPALPGQRTGMGQLIARALALVPPDSPEAGHLLPTYGRDLGLQESDYEGAQVAFGQALAIAQREQDAALEIWTLVHAANVDVFHLLYPKGVEKGVRAIELAHRAEDHRAEVAARYWTVYARLYMGDLGEARRYALAMLALAERLRDRSWLANALVANQTISHLGGDWHAARDFSDRGLAVSPMDTRHLASRVKLEYDVGDFVQGEVYLERLLEALRLTPPGPTMAYAVPAVAIPLAAGITSEVGQMDVAEAAAQTVLSSPSVTPNVAKFARAGLALLAVQRGDATAAVEQYAALESGRGTMIAPAPACVDRRLGLLAQTMGQLDKAAEHFEDALSFCRKAGYRPELAWTCCDYADMLLNPVGAGFKPAPTPAQRQKAMSLLDEALRISSELGMRPLMERVLSRREILQA